MAEDIIYADLHIPGASSSSRPPQQSQHLSSPACPRWHHIAVGVRWAGNIVLTIAVIALGVWGALNTSEKNETRIVNSTECSSCLEDFRSRLKPILCEPHNGSMAGSHRYPRWIWVALGLGGAGILVPLGAVIALAVWVSQLHISCEGQTRGALNTSEKNETGIVNSTECSSCLEDFRSRLKPILCEPHHSSLAEGSRCKLCPRDWLLHGDKCYWLSKESKDWTRSRDDCSRKSSRMLVIQTQEEMDFIQDVIRGESYVWIGLKVTPPRGTWTWVDNSHLHQTLFQVLGSAEGSSCGTLKGSRIRSETCDGEFKWICQKEAVVI